MNTLILLAIIGVGAVVVIAGIIAFQFVQEQQALNKLEKTLNPPKPEHELGYNTYQECLNYWNKGSHVEGIAEIMCEEYK
jgi:hypothetical protein